MLYRFEQYELDIDRNEFRANGDLCGLEPQVFDLLRHLIENRDRVVSRDELIKVIWHGRIVSESTIDTRLHAVRKSVGDDGQRQLRIKTVLRRGYRFVADVEIVSRQSELVDAKIADSQSISTVSADKPSIAVMPFDNLSDDPGQGYFADGIAEDIITALSRFHSFFVIARNSTIAYKGATVNVAQVGKELGVRYVVEGSVRKAGNRVRITAQLIEAASGNHIWAERYDRDLTDIFDIQDEITETIVGRIDIELRRSEIERARRKPPADIDAWDFFQRGHWHRHKATKEDNEKARKLFERAIERDPEFALAYAGLAVICTTDVSQGFSENPSETIAQGLAAAERAVAADDKESTNHYALGGILRAAGDRERSLAALHKSVALNPSFAGAYYGLAMGLNFYGPADEGIAAARMAMKLSPRSPALWAIENVTASLYIVLESYDDAVEWARKACHNRFDQFWPHLVLAQALAGQGQIDAAKRSIEQAQLLKTDLSVALWHSLLPSDANPDYIARWADLLRQAGLPE